MSSTAYAAIAAFVPSAVYSIGNIVKPTAPTQGTRYAFRCTVAGTASTEPTWGTAGNNNQTVVSGGATFTNVTGQSAWFWTAAAGDHQTLNGAVSTVRYAAGDRVFVSSDHAETVTSGFFGMGNTIAVGYGLLQFLCVNRAGSTPPVPADISTGATITASGVVLAINARVNAYYNGISFVQTGANQITFNSAAAVDKTAYYQNCTFFANTASVSATYTAGPQRVIFDNTTARFGATTQFFTLGPSELVWVNTPAAIPGATIPATLFNCPSSATTQNTVTLRGVDLSAITGTLVNNAGGVGYRFLFDSCRIASGVTRYSGGSNTTDIIELVNCYDGTNILSESYQPAGVVTTERTITLSGGATDNVGTFSHRMVSGANVDKFCNTLSGFWLDANYTTTGSSKTATVEIVSSASLNNDEISLVLEYPGTASSSVASFGNSFIATPLTTPGAVAASSAGWNSLPATPVRQHLQVTFTPQTAGRVRGRVMLGKPSTTVYYDPQVTIA